MGASQGSVIEKIDDDELVELHTKLDEIENKLTSLSAELKVPRKATFHYLVTDFR